MSPGMFFFPSNILYFTKTYYLQLRVRRTSTTTTHPAFITSTFAPRRRMTNDEESRTMNDEELRTMNDEAVVMKKGPDSDDASCIVWAFCMFLIYLLPSFSSTNLFFRL
jgi:hypothetical protein